MSPDVNTTIETVARRSFGRLVANLSARTRDVAGAEDALADAFRSALEQWPVSGVPDNPDAWLLTVARRRMIDMARQRQTRDAALPSLAVLAEESAEMISHGQDIPDGRLRLMFVCAHPAIDRAARAPLMLQTVLGLDAARMAGAFLISPATLGQRLSRAKTKIREAGISFDLPPAHRLTDRMDALLDAIYLAYGSGWSDVEGSDGKRKGLAFEAIELGRILTAFMPGHAEAMGLLALMLHAQARVKARRVQSRYIPLAEQDPRLWDRSLMAEAEAVLTKAGTLGRPGRFQLEAAIQSVHAARSVTGHTDWDTLAVLYEGLVNLAPTAGALVGRSAVILEVLGPAKALASLPSVEDPAIAGYQPYWAVSAHCHAMAGHVEAALAAYDRAISLSDDVAMTDYLAGRRKALLAS